MLHNLTPDGFSFLKAVKSSNRWFGGCQNVTVIDLGLSPVHLDMGRETLRPLSEIRGNHTTDQVRVCRPVWVEVERNGEICIQWKQDKTSLCRHMV